MSYRISVSFKNCEKKDIYKNMVKFSKLLMINSKDIIKRNLYFCKYNPKNDYEINAKIIDNFINDLFSYHIWYCNKIKALCFVCDLNNKQIEKFFDGYIFFQNSCDQDYDYEEWEFNKIFYKEVEKVKAMSIEQLNEIMKEKYSDDDFEIEMKNVDYYKKTIVYNKCYEIIEPIWDNGFRMSYLTGAIDEYKFDLRRKAYKLLQDKFKKEKK